MIITLMTNEKYNSITLPEKVGGQYWLKHSYNNEPLKDLISIEGVLDKWRAKSNKKASLIDNNGSILKNVDLSLLSICYVTIEKNKEKACIYTEPITEDRQIFQKYMIIKDNVELSIGRGIGNDIVFTNKFASSSHARIIYQNGKFQIFDTKSANGTFVNEQRITESVLHPGDVVYIMGLKLIIGNSFIALNNPDSQVEIKSKFLLPYIKQDMEQIDEDDEDKEVETNYFYRSPRFKRDVEEVEFKIDSPPQNMIGDEVPLMLTIGPSMTMGMASLTTAIFAINNALSTGDISRATPSIVMSASMLLGTIMWPIVTKHYEKRRKIKKEEQRQKKYREYLNKFISMFNDACVKQEEILHENYISIDECLERIQKVERKLWERGLGQNDFLKLRVGTGNSNLSAKIIYAERKFLVEDDNLQEEMLSICESPKILKNVPITVSLFENFISGIIGDENLTKEFVKGLIFQLLAYYSYDEVKLVFIFDEVDEKRFSFVKWVPHIWSSDKQIRFVATNIKESKEISSYLEKEIEVRKQLNNDDLEEITPYYIIFNMSKELASRSEILKQILSNKENLYFSVVSVLNELKDLPKECSTVVELKEGKGKIFDKNDILGQHTTFQPDMFIKQDTMDLSVKLANVSLDILEGSYKLPSLITFLEMFGVGKVEHLNSLTRWKENDPTSSLETAVGVNTLGDIFKIDLHEKFHGPHGLVAGMTGSGKSEFIISYILSLAVNYHPNEVAFILIDYKGGGMAKAFEKLPHTAGIITNLDGAAVKRSLISIESELRRRQTIFADASKKIGISNIDIYKYQKLYREGSVEEPLQHLFIISDEFAELKTQQPEFMAQLISAARIGRSLGVHLILATQKPSGVVDDQIWSNSRFRVCLKVQERSDSIDMLKRADAAELSDTGRFYLQVGYNELFELGQSAWAGAPYYPSDKVITEKNKNVTIVNRNGRPIRQAKFGNKFSFIPNPKKQLDVITSYLRDIAQSEGIKIKSLWLEPIPAMILVDDIRNKYSIAVSGGYKLNPVIGEYDDPVRQQQCALRLPLSQDGNAVIFGVAGSGKTTFLATTIYSLIKEHTPEQVNIYVLDFASETMKSFSKAPHVGDVILSYEAEKISNLFKMLRAETNSRKNKFTDSGGDFQSFIETSGEILPSIVVIINNYAAFTEAYEEKEEAVSYLAREGTKYGIYFILTAIGTNAIRLRLLQNFKQQFVLQLNDETDYTTILGKTDGLYPSKFKGRGLVKTDAIYEFQVANVVNEPNPFGFIRSFCETTSCGWHGEGAKNVPLLPEQVNIEFISNYVRNKNELNVPIGVEKSSLSIHYYKLNAFFINMILSTNDDYLDFVGAMVKLLTLEYSFGTTVFDSIGSFSGQFKDKINYYSKISDIEISIDGLFNLVAYRNNTYKDAVQNGEKVEQFEQKIVIINSLSSLKNDLSKESNEKLTLILEKGEIQYGVTVIIAEAVKNLTAYTFEKWYKKNITQTDGIWVGSGFMDQYQIKASKNTIEMKEEIDSDFGFSLVKGNAVKIKLLSQKETEGY